MSNNFNLGVQLTQVVKEKEDLKARLGSFTMVKGAVKITKVDSGAARAKVQKKAKTQEKNEGNHGFMVKNGQPASLVNAKVKIEVKPILKE